MHTALPSAGDHVWIRERRWSVERVRRHADVVRYDVAARDRRATFLAPFDRPVWTAAARRLRHAPPRQALARLADLIGRTVGDRTLGSVVNADVAILAHQLEPACACLDGSRRVLIADEVGLGKTIQAGIIVAEIVRRHAAARVLVVAPASLADQWSGELGRRFRIDCARADRAELESRSRTNAPGENPWIGSGVWIVSLDYLKQPHVLSALPLRAWDLVVIDEAHTACGESDRHNACSAIAQTARRVVLLTATPHDGDESRFARLLRLGELTDIADPLTVFRRTRRDISASITRRVRWRRVRLSHEESRLLAALTKYEHTVIGAAGEPQRDAALLLLSVFRKRALSTMGALAVSLRRRLAWLEHRTAGGIPEPVQRALLFDDEDAIGVDEIAGLGAEVGVDLRHERTWIRRLIGLADEAARRESKAAHVVAFARRAGEPVIVFTEFRDSLAVLKRRFGSSATIACLHGGQTPAERRVELARFLDGTASILIATDVASLGLNLQSRSRAVINLELPWTPVRLEQRAGRVDRIGQIRSIHITLIVARHDAESPVILRLAERALAAHVALGDDLTGEILASEGAIRAGVLAGARVQPLAAQTLIWRPSRHWIRPGRGMARCLTHQRALRSQWRAPDHDTRSARWSSARRLHVVREIAGSAISIVSIPLVDGAGTVVESHVIAVRVPALPGHRHRSPDVVESISRAASEALAPRARRLARRLERSTQLEIARERSIATHLASLQRDDGLQPGLFDRRQLQMFKSKQAARDFVCDAADRHVADLQRASIIEVGQPALALMFVDQP